jgi:histidinol-phosphate/aromatic aminotransferase/cobyric acid decarboxylase-like protein
LTSTCKEKRFVSHGGDIWGFSRKFNIPLEEVLEFSGPINFMGPPPKAVEAVKQNARLIKFYPDPNPVEFKSAIAKYVGHNVRTENILLGNGSIELIYLITELLSKPFKAVIPVPSFSENEKAALRLGGEIQFVKLPQNFALEMEKIKAAVTEDTKIMCICNLIVLRVHSTLKKKLLSWLTSVKKRTLSSALTKTISSSLKLEKKTQ